MSISPQLGRSRFRRLAAYALLLWFGFGALAPTLETLSAQQPTVQAAPEVNGAPAEEPGFFSQLLKNLFNSRELMKLLSQPKYTLLAFVALNLIIFTETGLLFGFFLPGDSLLVTAGVVCYATQAQALAAGDPSGGWNLPLLLGTLCVAAVVGDSVGYTIGFNAGPKLFTREKSWLFKKDHLLKAQEFYERHGGKTIVLARFMPLIRTFAPVVAGAGKMNYRTFLMFNVIGGVGWVVSMILIGFFLTRAINPALQPIFGPQFDVQDHIEKVIILVVLLSISPGIYVWLRSKFKGKPQAEAAVEQVPVRAAD
jgi:membrane-associated protein